VPGWPDPQTSRATKSLYLKKEKEEEEERKKERKKEKRKEKTEPQSNHKHQQGVNISTNHTTITVLS
jgi:hypothetical protein